MSYRILLTAALATLALTHPLAAAEDPVVAKIGTEEVKASQIKPYLAGLGEAEREALTRDPALLSQAVRTLILQQMLYKEALAANWEKNPDIAAQLERVRQSAVAESYLQSVAKVPESFPSDADVKAVYEARKGELNIPKQLRLGQIFIAAPEGDAAADQKARQRIEAVAKSLKASGANFAAIARDQSEERETASRGGEVGWLTEEVIRPEIRQKVTGLSKGGTTDPIRLLDGYYIVRVLEVNEPRTATLEEVRPRLVAALRAERARLNREAYLGKLQQQNPVALDEVGLSKILGNP